MVLNLATKIFIVYMLVLEIKTKILIDSLNKIIILAEYLDYADIFLFKFVVKLIKHNNSDYAIELEKNKQLSYSLIYSLELIKLKTLKTYIKSNLANSFI